MTVGNMEALADRLAASDAVARFYLYLDLYNWDGIRTLLDDAVSLTMGTAEVRPALQARELFMEELIGRNAGFSLGESGTFHGDFGHVVDLDGDHATVRCKFSAAHWLSSLPEDNGTLLGIYHVSLVRRGQSWKIQRIWIQPIRSTGDARRLFEAGAANWQAHARLEQLKPE